MLNPESQAAVSTRVTNRTAAAHFETLHDQRADCAASKRTDCLRLKVSAPARHLGHVPLQMRNSGCFCPQCRQSHVAAQHFGPPGAYRMTPACSQIKGPSHHAQTSTFFDCSRAGRKLRISSKMTWNLQQATAHLAIFARSSTARAPAGSCASAAGCAAPRPPPQTLYCCLHMCK